jgi:hypothetical protein
MIRRWHAGTRPCPPRARQEGGVRRFTVIHGASGSALDLCCRRAAGRGHHLCKLKVEVWVVSLVTTPGRPGDPCIVRGRRVLHHPVQCPGPYLFLKPGGLIAGKFA